MSSVDVVVPCYRYGHFLQECVNSVLAQQDVDIRVLVIDDASPDNTAEVAERLARQSSRVTFVRHSANKGHIATYNEGIEWASADYYMILSADDYLLPGALADSARVMDTHPNVGLTYGEAITLTYGDTTYTGYPKTAGTNTWRILPGQEFIRRSGARNIVPTPTAIVRTRLQKRLGGYRIELPHSGDLEMWLRLAVHSDVAVSGRHLAVYRRHSENMSLHYTTSNGLLDLQQRKAALDSFFSSWGASLPNSNRARQRAHRLLAMDAVSLASALLNKGVRKTSYQLLEFALETYPRIKLSLPWAKVTAKVCIGQRVLQALYPIVTKLRGNAN